MLKSFTYKIFNYKDRSYQDISDVVNDSKEISLKHNKDLITRVYNRYPFLSKIEIALIVKECFILWRELLIHNKVIYMAEFIPHIYIHVSKKFNKKHGEHSALKVNVCTPQKVKKDYDD